MSILFKAIENAASSEIRLDLLFTGLLIYRKRFLYEYLEELYKTKGKIQKSVIDEMVYVAPFSSDEMDELVRYIVNVGDFSVVIFRQLDSDHMQTIVDTIRQLISEGQVSVQMLSILGDNTDYLISIQAVLKEYLSKNADYSEKILPYIRINSKDDLAYFENRESIFLVYRALSRNKWNIEEYESDDLNVRISLQIIHEKKLSEEQWIYVREQINNVVSSTTDIDSFDMSFYAFLRGLAKLDMAYAEKIYVSLYEQTGLYSNRILSEMTEVSVPYAYRILTNRLLSVNNDRIRRKSIAKLLKHYGASARDTYEHVLQLEDEALIEYTKEIAEKYDIQLISNNEARDDFTTGEAYRILDRSVVVSDLLIRLAKEIKAKFFMSAVGFAYTSGLKMLKSVFDEVEQNGGKIELIIGSLQTYGLGGKNTRIDKNSAKYLNSLIDNNNVSIYTYQNSFYHGKYYYLANDEIAYIIMGSSNISKTAFLSNYELDSFFRVERGSGDDNRFREWYQGFRYECESLPYLDEEQFEEFNWNSEQQAYGARRVVHISHSEITDRIDKLTDIDTKRRLNMWLSHDPSEILSNLEISALDGYIVFLFVESGLAVFESFVPGNAFYSFRYDDIERLFVQLSKLSKSEMLVASDFLMRGYHIQDQERLESKVEKLFRENSI